MLDVAGELAMAVVPAATYVDLAKASDVLGHNEVRLATEEEFAGRFPDCEVGAEPPFGNLYGIPVFLDLKLRLQPRLVCRDGSHTRTISVTMDDYLRLVAPEVVDISTD
jgi:Ala-tRNA(Pro) deacylase